MNAPHKGLLERLKDGIILGSEGYIFELERRGYIKAGPYVPEVVVDFPDAVRELHGEFQRAGSEVMVALTYYAHREKLKDVGRENDLERMNRSALALATEIGRAGGSLIAGNVCNTWAYNLSDVAGSSAVVRAMYEEQIGWAVDAGVDFVIAETNDYLGEALLALEVIKRRKLPAMVTLASVHDKTRDGYDYVEACKRLAAHGADVVGLNCDRGPATMLPIIEKVRRAVDCYVAAQPVPYRTTAAQPTFQSLGAEGGRAFPLALEPYLCTRFELADFARRARDVGVNYIGICCGGAPHYVRAMAEALGRTPPASRYSPAMDLHPMLGTAVDEHNKTFLSDWKGS
jgi:betaine-homocysteine S-methyltransferase